MVAETTTTTGVTFVTSGGGGGGGVGVLDSSTTTTTTSGTSTGGGGVVTDIEPPVTPYGVLWAVGGGLMVCVVLITIVFVSVRRKRQQREAERLKKDDPHIGSRIDTANTPVPRAHDDEMPLDRSDDKSEGDGAQRPMVGAFAEHSASDSASAPPARPGTFPFIPKRAWLPGSGDNASATTRVTVIGNIDPLAADFSFAPGQLATQDIATLSEGTLQKRALKARVPPMGHSRNTGVGHARLTSRAGNRRARDPRDRVSATRSDDGSARSDKPLTPVTHPYFPVRSAPPPRTLRIKKSKTTKKNNAKRSDDSVENDAVPTLTPEEIRAFASESTDKKKKKKLFGNAPKSRTE